MAIDRRTTGLTVLRILVGVFFLFMGINKVGWFLSAAPLSEQFSTWMDQAAPGSISHWYLEHVALRGVPVFARIVPLGEIVTGLALIVGFWTPLFAFLAFFMWLNFQIAGDTIFHYRFLTNGFGLPILGSTLALAIGGVRLPWSIRG